jgi:hypothetical protein
MTSLENIAYGDEIEANRMLGLGLLGHLGNPLPALQ